MKEVGDNAVNEIAANRVGAQVTVCNGWGPPEPGDANGDGIGNSLEITKVERIIVGLD